MAQTSLSWRFSSPLAFCTPPATMITPVSVISIWQSPRAAHGVVVRIRADCGHGDVAVVTGKQGVDIAIDNLGTTVPETLRCMTQGGVIVVLGNVSGEPVPVMPGLLIGRRLRR